MSNKPHRQRRHGGGRPYSIINRQRDLSVSEQAETIEQSGYTFQIMPAQPQCFQATTDTGTPFYRVSAFGKTREDAIINALGRIGELKARVAA